MADFSGHSPKPRGSKRTACKMASTLFLPVTGTLGAAKSLALQPAFPASLLVLLAYAPRHVVDRVLAFPVMQRIVSRIGVKGVKAALGTLLTLGVVKVVNRCLSAWALNNWSLAPHKGWEWQTELAVVTGGCSGIGKSLTLGLVKKGVRVAVLDVADLPADMAGNPSIKYWKCDISSPDSVREVADDIRLTIGHPSLVFNNAGIAIPGPILQTEIANLNKIMGVNLLSLWSTTKEFLPNMILKNKGHVITVTSAASYFPLPNNATYSASKAGALSFGEGLRWELKNTYKAPGVLTTVVHPWWVMTGMTAPYADRIEETYGELMTPDVVANAVLKQVFSCKGGHVFVPESSSWVSLLRSLPTWMMNTKLRS
jgi:all-trans-retinol dehydrogenase (NAD+)